MYGDGRTGWNNPTREAIMEACNIWSNCPIAIVISIGTGVKEVLQLNENSTLLSKQSWKSVVQKQDLTGI